VDSEIDVLIKARGITKKFENTLALKDISIAIQPGELIALIGPSGSGKSTLLLCLAGILRPDKGEIFFRGNSLQHLGESGLSRLRRTKFGILFQFGQLISELTAVENVALPLMLEGVNRREAESQALAALALLDVEDLAERRPTHMSGGQAQRVALARSFVTNPEVIFADEPTGALDTKNGEIVVEALMTMARLRRTAVVLVTHDAHVAAYADRQLAVRDGRLDTTS
jgi:putative ABC transport system ATP-binding protein